MLAANYTTVRERFKEFCDRANEDAETIVVIRKFGGNVVLLSEDSYNHLLENLFVRSNKKEQLHQIDSIQQLKQEMASEKDLIDD